MIVSGNTSDDGFVYTKSTSIQLWLFGYEIPGNSSVKSELVSRADHIDMFISCV